jgi:ATP-grasp domain, R2K clade family 3
MFVIQYNLMHEQSLLKIKTALEQNKIPHIFVGLIPFSHEIIYDKPIIGTEYIPYGSTSFTEVTYGLNWRGQYFNPATFRAEVWNTMRVDMVNAGNCTMTIKEALVYLSTINIPNHKMFLRPCEDLKSFSGQVMEISEAITWLNSALSISSSSNDLLTLDTSIVVAEQKDIQAEWRYFIIGGVIISGSMYRRNGILYKEEVTEFSVLEEAQRIADKWLPSECCVMDLALVEDEIKVLEFNTINACGFYNHNVNNIIVSLWEYFLKTKSN